jgi:endonuclease/exonuclease/phosphatase family metal-dependent hydrolase
VQYFLLLLFPLLLVAKPFKVASYNVENLFDVKYQGTEYNDYIPGKHNWNQRMVEIKLNHTAEVICDLDADILGLQEIENSFVFEALLKRLKRVGCEYSYSAITHKKGAAIQVALLSRFPIKNRKELQVSYAPYVRNILEVEVAVKGEPLTLFVNHWKSKSRKGFESKRIKYAKRLQKRILSLSATKEYIVLGDLNSNYNAHLTLNERLNDSNGVTGITDVLKTIQDGKLIQEHQILKTGRASHYNAWQELPFKHRWSHKYYGNKGTLDHILLPSSMFNGKGLDYVNDSFSVFKAPYLFTKKGYINSWQYKNGKHLGKGYSDHLPVYAFFSSKPYEADKNSNKTSKTVSKNIEYFYQIDSLEQPVELKDAVVVLKRGRYAVVKQTAKGRGVFLYGCVNGLEEGRKYDLLVQDITSYKGLQEITDLVKIKDKGSIDLNPFYNTLNSMRQNEVLKEFDASYKNKNLYIDSNKIPVYFKNKKLTPKNGSKLKIHYAHLGYYKKLQLVIYSKKDFEIIE